MMWSYGMTNHGNEVIHVNMHITTYRLLYTDEYMYEHTQLFFVSIILVSILQQFIL